MTILVFSRRRRLVWHHADVDDEELDDTKQSIPKIDTGKTSDNIDDHYREVQSHQYHHHHHHHYHPMERFLQEDGSMNTNLRSTRTMIMFDECVFDNVTRVSGTDNDQGANQAFILDLASNVDVIFNHTIIQNCQFLPNQFDVRYCIIHCLID
jgi:hypothetical protein